MAEQVDEDAQYTLSLCYYNEVGVAQDYVQAGSLLDGQLMANEKCYLSDFL